MGLATLPSPAEGMLCVILVNTAISINILKHVLRSLLQVVGINYPPLNSDPCAAAFTGHHPVVEREFLYRRSHSETTYVEEFRHRNPAVKFDTVKRSNQGCSVCLTRFKPDTEVNQLDCGHVFHKACLEKWMDYWNNTCPLCRTPMLPHEEDEDKFELY